MSDPEKILITELPTDAIWRRLRDKFRAYDVEADSEEENVYDLREADILEEDIVYFWGRDGWSDGFWHARIYLERSPATKNLVVYAERGAIGDCLPLLPLRRRLMLFMEDCMTAVDKKGSE
jgi:hypothetical protein